MHIWTCCIEKMLLSMNPYVPYVEARSQACDEPVPTATKEAYMITLMLILMIRRH